MKSRQYIFTFFLCCLTYTSFTQNVAQLHETARTFMRQGDYSNAILVLNRAVILDHNNLELLKDLGLNYYFAKDYNRALSVCKPLLDRDDADDQCFQITGDIYQALGLSKDCEKVYKKGLRKIPGSGALYNELGELQWGEKDYSCIKQWEKGIEMDPGFSKNYYNACRYYYFTADKVWSILFGEIFLNIEPMSPLAPEIKNILLEGYKKLFADADLEKNNREKSSFILAFLHTMNKQTALATGGIDTESLTMIRSRFILDWFNNYADKFSYRLFDYQKLLLQEGLFDAYNQWLFTATQNLPAYQNWTETHVTEYKALLNFQKGRIFKIPQGQYYHTRNN